MKKSIEKETLFWVSIGIFVINVFVFSLTGCGGHRSANMVYDNNGRVSQWKDTNITLFQPSIRPGNVANANLTNSQANINNAIAVQISTGKAADFSDYSTGVIVNQDPKRTVLVYHPERSEIRAISPGGYSVFLLKNIPEYIFARFSGKKKNVQYKIFKAQKVFNGINTDFGARIQS